MEGQGGSGGCGGRAALGLREERPHCVCVCPCRVQWGGDGRGGAAGVTISMSVIRVVNGCLGVERLMPQEAAWVEAAGTSWRWTQSRRRLLQLAALCKGVKLGAFHLLRGHPPAAAAAGALGQVGPEVLMPPPCPVQLLLPCFLASEEPPGCEEGQEQGKA